MSIDCRSFSPSHAIFLSHSHCLWALGAQHMTASTIPPLSVWPCGTPFGNTQEGPDRPVRPNRRPRDHKSISWPPGTKDGPRSSLSNIRQFERKREGGGRAEEGRERDRQGGRVSMLKFEMRSTSRGRQHIYTSQLFGLVCLFWYQDFSGRVAKGRY